jgi:glutamine synthetase
MARRVFNPHLIDNFLRTKRQEKFHFDQLAPEEQLELYLDTV